MNKENVTNIEQSLRLAELIGTETADMVYVGGNKENLRVKDKSIKWYKHIDVFAWSFGALVDLLPEDQLEVWHINSLTMYEGYSCWTNSPAGCHSWNGKTKLEAVFNSVIDIYERRAQR